MLRKFVGLAGFALWASSLGCATTHIKGKGGSLATRRSGPAPALAGVWEGLFEGKIEDGVGAGDTRIERQAWHLEQQGSTIAGYYVVELTMISGDGRAYLCSQEPRFSTKLRFQVRGEALTSGIELHEVGDMMTQGPCRPGYRTPSRFHAEVQGDVLTLSEGPQRMKLFRRSGAVPASTTTTASQEHLVALTTPGPRWTREETFPSSIGLADTEDEPTPVPIEVGGLWVWEHRGPVPNGDEKQEREEWHLDQEGNRLSGYYDRVVRQISTDGNAYRCSNALEFRVVTRYHVSGEVQGSRVVLYERSFEILEGSPCDSGQRRLDAYQGEAGSAEIRLMWGVGAQVLHRARPNIPTQRF